MKYSCGHQFLEDPGTKNCPAIIGYGKRCNAPKDQEEAPKKEIKPKKAKPDLEGMLDMQLHSTGISGYRRQVRFHSKRRWKFDFAFEDIKLAIEIHGGTYSRGAHSRGPHQRKDFEKWSIAGIDRWVILHFDTKDVQGKQRVALNRIISALEKLCPSKVSHIG